MPRLLKRYRESGSDHFITFSSYYRLPYLDDNRIQLTFLDMLE